MPSVAVIEPYIYGVADDSLTGLAHTFGTVQHRTNYSPRSLSDDLLLALASLGPERAREAFASIKACPVPDVAVRDQPDPRRASESHLNRFFLALSDETRRSILRLLEAREHCVNEIRSHFELSQPTISRHLKVLKQARLVTDRRKGQRVFYCLSDDRLALSMNQFFSAFEQCQRKLA